MKILIIAVYQGHHGRTEMHFVKPEYDPEWPEQKARAVCEFEAGCCDVVGNLSDEAFKVAIDALMEGGNFWAVHDFVEDNEFSFDHRDGLIGINELVAKMFGKQN